MFPRFSIFLAASLIAFGSAAAQSPSTRNIPQSDSSYIDAEGTAHVTRVVPVPLTVSPEAQKSLARQRSDAPNTDTLAQRRAHTDTWQNATGEKFRQLYPATVEKKTIAGVPCRIITPRTLDPEKGDRVLLNVHGGGFNSDSGSLTETIPVAYLTKTKVIAILYRLAPEQPFPAAVEDTVAVYREILKTYRPAKVALFGTSAGAILTAEVAVQLRKSNVPLPGALGIFSGLGDFSRDGDSEAIFSLSGLSGPLKPPVRPKAQGGEYVGRTDLRDPVLSPVFADLKGFPPTLFLTSTRDLLLSGTTILHRAFLHAGVPAQLVVFEALPHAFWNDPSLPETKEADGLMADFFDKALGR